MEADISATEDLMREHGMLDRVLLIYEEGIRRLAAQEEIAPNVFQETTALVRHFVEEYHERLEEDHIFPVFVNAGRLQDLVSVLKEQHDAGRAITDGILRQSNPDRFRKQENRQQLMALCRAYINMYRPHSAREDTVLFPLLRTLLSADRIQELGEKFEEQEHKLFGEGGFQENVERVATIEKQLNIHDLKTFTPEIPQQ